MQTETPIETGGASMFASAQISESGGRSYNEDFCGRLELEQAACWVLADGLGGHHGGALASRTATEAILESFRANPEIAPQALQGHIDTAQAAVQKLQTEQPEAADMRTTVVMLVSDYRRAIWAHVGDSRLYRFHSRGLEHQTEDHSVPQSLVCAGDITADQIRGHPDRNRLLRSLGEKGPARPTVLPEAATLSTDDAFLLCSDGFWEFVWETEMLADLAASETPAQWLDRAASRVRARAGKGHDNYSAVGVFCSGPNGERRNIQMSLPQGQRGLLAWLKGPSAARRMAVAFALPLARMREL